MDNVALAEINSFASPVMQAVFESPSEEAVFILNSGQLSEVISQAVQKAIEPFQDHIDDLKKMVAAQSEQIAALTSTQEQDVNRICLDIAYDRQRLAKLEKGQCSPPITPPPGGKTVSRIEKVKDFLKTRGGGATFQECERLLDIHPNQMNKLVSQLDKRSFEVFTRAGDRRQRVLRLKAQIVSRER